MNQFELQDYTPEAVICNFYDKKDHMGGHLDDGEPDQLHPIISYSFGLSCVFLVGGRKKTVKPHALKLESGDILIMSKEARLCYHGVPRVLEGSFDKERFEKELDLGFEGWREIGVDFDVVNDWKLPKNEFRHVLKYLEGNRVNINIRQVFFKGEEEKILGEKKLEEEKKGFLGEKKDSFGMELAGEGELKVEKKMKFEEN